MTSLKVKNPVFTSGHLLLEHGDGWRQAGTQRDPHLMWRSGQSNRGSEQREDTESETPSKTSKWGNTVAVFWGLLKDISCSIAVLYSGLSAHCGSQRNSKTIHLTATRGSRPWRQISKIASSQTKRQKVVSSPSPHPLTPTSALPREPSLQGPRQNTLHLIQGFFSGLWPRKAGAADSSQSSAGKDSRQEPALAIRLLLYVNADHCNSVLGDRMTVY